jgi:hypothetical protein
MSKPFKYSKKYVNSLTDYELRKLSDENLYKLQKLYKIHPCGICDAYTPKEIASIINKNYKSGRSKKKKSKSKRSKRHRSMRLRRRKS